MKNNSLGSKIRSIRREKQLTQQDVAGDFITRNMLSKIESGIANPSIKTIEYLAMRLDKPVSYFLDNESENINNSDDAAKDLKDNYEIVFEHSSQLIKENELDKCINFLEKFIKDSQSNISTFYYCRILYNLALCYYNKKQYEKAKYEFEEVKQKLLENKDYYYLSNSCFRLDYINYTQNNYLESVEYGKQAIAYLHKSYINDVLYEIKLYFSLSFSCRSLQKYSEAITNLSIALELSKKYNCHYNSGEIHMLMANILYKTKMVEEAISHAEKAIEFFKFTENYDMQATTHKNLSIFLIAAKRYDEAIEYLEKALQYYSDTDNITEVNTIKCVLLECLVKKELYKDAIDYSEYIDLNTVKKDDKGNTIKFLGKSYFELKDFDNAKRCLLEAKEILLSISRYDYLSDTCTLLAQLYSATQQYKEAYEYSAKANEFLEKSIAAGLIYTEN